MTNPMVAQYDEATGRLLGVRENPDGSIDHDSLPLTVKAAVADISDWVHECRADGTIEGVLDMTDTRRRTPQGERKAPKFVRFHQFDSGTGCDEIFWEDPHTFTPRRGRNGYVDSWGIYPHDRNGVRDVDGMRIAERSMVAQHIYKTHKVMKPPELQFIDALMEKKVAALKDIDIGYYLKSDYTLYISLPHIPHPKDSNADRYWRRVRVSGGLPLGVFADKVLTPIWGWVRNLHAHVYHDFSDGALFGPKDCNAIDMMHLDKSGYAYIPEEDYRLAHLLREPGQVIGYHYDFGDNWWIDIKLEAITPPWESTGAVTLLDGAGGTPPDGEQCGTFNWAHYLKLAQRSPTAKRQAVALLFGATNYADRLPPSPSQASHYDFDAFDIEEARARVRAALDSKASMPSASKKAVAGLSESDAATDDIALMLRLGVHPSQLKKGTGVVQTPAGDGVFWEEGVRDRRADNPGNTACAWCGSPHELKLCTRCRQRYYCSKTCQKAHWQGGHKALCLKTKA